MRALDGVAPNFRLAVTQWPDARTLAAHFEDLAATYEGNKNSVIELTKSLLESVCTTILRDVGRTVDGRQTTTELLKYAAEAVGLVHSRGAARFDKVLSAYFKLTDALNDLRNTDGTVAHGKDGFLDELCENHLRIYVLTADAAVALLLGALKGVDPDLLHTRRPFRTFEHFNIRIDASVRCSAEVVGADSEEEPPETGPSVVLEFTTDMLDAGVSLILRPSELLFAHDRGAYVEVLNAAPAKKKAAKKKAAKKKAAKKKAAKKKAAKKKAAKKKGAEKKTEEKKTATKKTATKRPEEKTGAAKKKAAKMKVLAKKRARSDG